LGCVIGCGIGTFTNSLPTPGFSVEKHFKKMEFSKEIHTDNERRIS